MLRTRRLIASAGPQVKTARRLTIACSKQTADAKPCCGCRLSQTRPRKVTPEKYPETPRLGPPEAPPPRSTNKKNRPRRNAAANLSQTPGRLHPARSFRALRPMSRRSGHRSICRRRRRFSRQWGQELAGWPPDRPSSRGVRKPRLDRLVACRSRSAGAHDRPTGAPVFALLGPTAPSDSTSRNSETARGAAPGPVVAVLGNDGRAGTPESEIPANNGSKTGIARPGELLPRVYDQVVGGVSAVMAITSPNDRRPALAPGAIERALAQRQARRHHIS